MNFILLFFFSYQLYQVTPKDKSSFEALVQLYEKSENYDFWTEPRGINDAIDIMVPPAYISVFVQLLETFQMEYRVKIVNVQT